ncbi:hypothetical protein B296_00005896 [Ensete ventricosum]|uniref:Uncharacterized protein n=1 Tax=Ensete ventricosum TaxID=4639 RepID=A0A427AHP2_ENSVE|nr:hypothetical protein B296_00005896 [Ensete ventricosum]
MRHDLPPRHHGSRYNLHAPAALSITLTASSSHPCANGGGPLRAAVGSRPLQLGCGRHSHLLLAATLAGLAVIGRPCKGAGHGLPPLQVAWLWSAALVEDLAMVDRPLSLLLSP